MSGYREIGQFRRRLSLVRELLQRRLDWKFMIYRLKWTYAPKLGLVTRAPVNLDIEPTEACNLKCVMCPQAFDAFPDHKMIDVEMTKRVIDQAAELGVYSVKFTWRGEPALHRQLAELVRHAKDRGILEVQFTTNGTPFTEKKIREFIEAGLDRVIFSVDGATRETVEKIRVGVDFDRLANNIRTFHRIRTEMGRKKPFIRVQMVRMKQNVQEVEQFREMWKPYVDDVRVSDVMDRGQGSGDAVGDQVAVGRAVCPQPFRRMVVSSNGEVVPCCSDWNKQWVIGDVRQHDLLTMWKSPKMQEIRRLLREKRLDEFAPCNRCFVKESYVWQKMPLREKLPAERA